MKWYVASKDYINYLHEFDSKVENINYSGRLKPYLGIILAVGNYSYYVPASSPKAKHEKMKNGKDFFKVEDEKSGKLLAVLNLNNMIPIPNGYIEKLSYDDIEHYRSFDSQQAKEQYTILLQKELSFINRNASVIMKKACKLRNHYIMCPDDNLSARCCNFTLLEQKCEEYEHVYTVHQTRTLDEQLAVAKELARQQNQTAATDTHKICHSELEK